MATDLDVRFQTALADHFPTCVVNPTGVARALRRGRGAARRSARRRALRPPARPAPRAPGDRCRCSGAAPDFTGNQRWFNTPGEQPLTLAELRGRVVLVDFWTYTCINCIRTLPTCSAWDAALPRRGPHDRRRPHAGVRLRARRRQRRGRDRAERAALPGRPGQRLRDLERVGQPVLAREVPDRRQGPASATRTSARASTTRPRRRSARCSPRRGAERARAPAPRVGAAEQPAAARPRPRPTSAPRAPRASCPAPSRRTARAPTARRRPLPRRATSRSAAPGTSTASRRPRGRDATLDADVVGKDVYLVLSSRGGTPRPRARRARRPPDPRRDAGADVRDGRVTVRRQRLYRLVAPRDRRSTG